MFATMIKIVSLFTLIYYVTENHGKSIKIQIDCDDILKILAGLTNQDYKIPDTPFEIMSKVDKNGKDIKNPYHPEDITDKLLSNQWEAKQEVEMDLMKTEFEEQLDRENHNFISKPAVISEDELEDINTLNQSKKIGTKINAATEDYSTKLMKNNNVVNSKLQNNKKDSILTERKKEIDAIAIENNAVNKEHDLVAKDFEMNQKRFHLTKGSKDIKNDHMRIDDSPAKTGIINDEERAKRPPDDQDFKDFQRRFILVSGPDKKKISN